MTDEEREKRNARRRKDPNRPLEWMMLLVRTMGEMLEVKAKQCQDCVGMFKYLATHPQMGNRIPGAATWGKEKCMRMLQIRGEIAADCPLFHRENGDIICTAWPLDEVAQAIETRITNSKNAKGGGKGGSTGDRLHDRTTEKEIEGEIETETETAARADGMSTAPRAGVQARAKDAGEVFAFMCGIEGVNLNAEQRRAAASAFFDELEACGWVNRHGQKVTNWQAAARKWMHSWSEREALAAQRNRNGQAPPMPSRNKGTFNDRDHSDYDRV